MIARCDHARRSTSCFVSTAAIVGEFQIENGEAKELVRVRSNSFMIRTPTFEIFKFKDITVYYSPVVNGCFMVRYV
jgi:hypothetical protein